MEHTTDDPSFLEIKAPATFPQELFFHAILPYLDWDVAIRIAMCTGKKEYDMVSSWYAKELAWERHLYQWLRGLKRLQDHVRSLCCIGHEVVLTLQSIMDKSRGGYDFMLVFKSNTEWECAFQKEETFTIQPDMFSTLRKYMRDGLFGQKDSLQLRVDTEFRGRTFLKEDPLFPVYSEWMQICRSLCDVHGWMLSETYHSYLHGMWWV